jgi:hypothetical protein
MPYMLSITIAIPPLEGVAHLDNRRRRRFAIDDSEKMMTSPILSSVKMRLYLYLKVSAVCIQCVWLK